MRELNVNEVNEVNGGLLQLIAGALVGGYIYDFVGGRESIDNWVENSYASASASARYHIRKLL